MSGRRSGSDSLGLLLLGIPFEELKAEIAVRKRELAELEGKKRKMSDYHIGLLVGHVLGITIGILATIAIQNCARRS